MTRELLWGGDEYNLNKIIHMRDQLFLRFFLFTEGFMKETKSL